MISMLVGLYFVEMKRVGAGPDTLLYFILSLFSLSFGSGEFARNEN